MIRRALLVVATIVAIVAGSPGTASAHAELVSTTPTNQSVVDESPTEVVLTFSEAIDPIDPAIRIVDADGAEVDASAATQDRGADTLAVTIDEPLDDGTYVVAWQAVSADSPNIRGAFTFSVGEASPTRPGLVDDVFASADAPPGGSGFLGVGRFAGYAGIAVGLGGLFAATTIAPRTLTSRRTGRILWAGLGVALVGTAIMISAQANMIGSSPLDWSAVADTRSGRWWVLRLFGFAALAPLIAGRRALTTLAGRTVALASGIGVLAVVAAGGHAVTGRWIPVGYVATVAHLAAMTIWVGGLVVLALGLKRSDITTAANRFSPWALGSVAVLAVSGSVNGWRQIGSPGGITESSYGRWPIVKLSLVAVVVVVAAVSRAVLHRSSTSSAAVPLALSAAPVDEPRQAGGERLRASVWLEVVGVALVVAATSGLVDSPPPELDAPTNQLVSTVQGDRIAQVELEPAITGGTVMHVTITSPRGGLDRADEITVTAELVADGIGPIDIDTIDSGPNHVIADDANFPVPGLWTVEVTARYGEFDQIVFDVDIPVES
ncbi:MAG: copper resistance protein CopC [Ilumatobacter sp.]